MMEQKIEQIIKDNWSKVLNTEVSVDDNFFDLGGNSYKALISLLGINEELKEINAIDKVEISIEDIFKEGSVSNLTKFTMSLETQSKVFYPLSKSIDPSRKNVFFFPPIFGISSVFNGLEESLDCNCYAINYKEANQSISQYTQYLYQYLVDNYSSIDVLVGYSYGGIICYELCRLFEKNQHQKIELIIIDASPIIAKENTITLDIIMEESKFWGIGTIDTSFKTHIKDIIAHRLENLMNYSLIDQIQGEMLLVIAQENEIYNEDLKSQWKKHIQGEIQEILSEGNHYSMIQGENRSKLASIINNYLNR